MAMQVGVEFSKVCSISFEPPHFYAPVNFDNAIWLFQIGAFFENIGSSVIRGF